uniref:Uncharacterized protein n=1 Tax=Strombidium rassoulzadegani TaxID=1082188 RepID=A0A7S3G019_9SPIT
MNKSHFLSLVLVVLLTIDSSLAGSIFKMKVKNTLSTDFLTGFESGIFMRNNTNQFDEYGCPDESVDSEEYLAFKKAIEPIKAMTGFLTGGKPDPMIDEIISTVDTFVASFDKFIGVFDENYTGGDFCAGLTFGMQGSQMLETIAVTLYDKHLKSKAQEARNHAKSGL